MRRNPVGVSARFPARAPGLTLELAHDAVDDAFTMSSTIDISRDTGLQGERVQRRPCFPQGVIDHLVLLDAALPRKLSATTSAA